MCVIRMVIYVVLTSLIIVPNKLAVTTVPNLAILVWDVPSNAGKLVLSQLQPYATNVARKVTLHVAAQRLASLIGRKASPHHTVRERKNGKKTPVLDQLLMMPVKQVKEKAPISRKAWTLSVNPNLRGGWTGGDDLDDLPFKKYKSNGWGSPSTPKKPYTDHQLSSGGDYFTPQSSRRCNHGYTTPYSNYSPSQWRMQDDGQGGAETMDMLICMKI